MALPSFVSHIDEKNHCQSQNKNSDSCDSNECEELQLLYFLSESERQFKQRDNTNNKNSIDRNIITFHYLFDGLFENGEFHNTNSQVVNEDEERT